MVARGKEGVGVGGKWVCLQKGNRMDPCGDANVLYLYQCQYSGCGIFL